MFRRQPADEFDDPPMNPKINPRGPGRWGVLATYNSERARGIVHTAEWDELMAEEQEKFDVVQRARWVADGTYVVSG